MFPFLENGLILVGHSLGGLFLIKYLSENHFPKKITAIFLVAAPHVGKNEKHALGTFSPPKDFSGLEEQVENIFIYHSKDDEVVPFSDFEKYKDELPKARSQAFEDRGHFNGDSFPELYKDIAELFLGAESNI